MKRLKSAAFVFCLVLLPGVPSNAAGKKDTAKTPEVRLAEAPTHYLELVMDVAQLFFWTTAGLVTIFTFRLARRTILQPIRTELFKAQLEPTTQIMKLFVGKEELYLRGVFNFDKLFTVNTCALYDAYATEFFDAAIDRSERPYLRECPRYVTPIDWAPEPATGYLRNEDDLPQPVAATDPDMRAARWAQYRHVRLYVNREFCEMEALLDELLQNPLLPSGLIALLSQYRSQAERNQEVLRCTLVEVAKEMPSKYPSLDVLQRAKYDWIRYKWIAKVQHLKPIADQIVAFIRSYFDPEILLRPQKYKPGEL